MEKLNILVLHKLGNPTLAPICLCKNVFALKTYAPEHNYIYHDVSLPLPRFIIDLQFDAIVLDVTLLIVRWGSKEEYRRILGEYAFVKYSNAVKLAFPQDEYDCNEILDEWMCDWKVDIVYSVISSKWKILYPKFHLMGEIRLGYTGYIDESLISIIPKPFNDRQVDIGYRARKLLPYFGRIGETKNLIGAAVAKHAREKGLKVDIAVGLYCLLMGQSWLDFINDCKFTLGTNSGSSLLDPYGSIQREVKKYLKMRPSATFEEVETACFLGLDRGSGFTAISPRIFEAGILESCQILVEGEYSSIIKPWDHYIPIKSDADDFDQVYSAMQDKLLVEKMRKNCKEAILDFKDLRASNMVDKIIDLITERKTQKKVISNFDAVTAAKKQYLKEMALLYQKSWKIQYAIETTSRIVNKYSLLRGLKNSIRSLISEV